MGEKRAYERPRVIRLSSGWAAEGASSCDAPGSGDAGYCETGNTAGYICVSTGNTAVVGCDGDGNSGSVVP